MSSEFGAGSLEGRTFRVAVMGAEGEASEATVFEYHERDGVIWARYEAAPSASASWLGRDRATDWSSATAS